MVAYSFQRIFVEPIIAGTKRQTIRADRKRHARPGEEMQLYVGMRTKHCRLIRRVVCKDVSTIRLSFYGAGAAVINEFVDVRDLDKFARQDGFAGWTEMRGFWAEHHPGDKFVGVLIEWEPINAA